MRSELKCKCTRCTVETGENRIDVCVYVFSCGESIQKGDRLRALTDWWRDKLNEWKRKESIILYIQSANVSVLFMLTTNSNCPMHTSQSNSFVPYFSLSLSLYRSHFRALSLQYIYIVRKLKKYMSSWMKILAALFSWLLLMFVDVYARYQQTCIADDIQFEWIVCDSMTNTFSSGFYPYRFLYQFAYNQSYSILQLYACVCIYHINMHITHIHTHTQTNSIESVN